MQMPPGPCLSVDSARCARQAYSAFQAQPDQPCLGTLHDLSYIYTIVAAHLLQRCGQDATDGAWDKAAAGEHQSQAS